MGVPNTFANATTTIPLLQLDQNFATPITLGVTQVGLGNTVTNLANVTISGGVTTTWVPVDASGAGLSLTVNDARYRVWGPLVFVWADITYPVNADGNQAAIGGLPGTVLAGSFAGGGFPVLGLSTDQGLLTPGTSQFTIETVSSMARLNAGYSGGRIRFQLFFPTA